MRYEKPTLADHGSALDHVLTVGIYKNPIAPDGQIGSACGNGYCPGESDE